MEQAHFDVAAHGVLHDDLSAMSRQQQAYQIDGSVDALRAHLHEPVDSYAYPSGRFNEQSISLLRAAGVPLAVTTDPRYIIAPQNGLELVRVRVRSDWTLADFANAIARALRNGRVVLR